MMKTNEKGVAALLAENSMQSSLLKDSIEASSQLKLKIISAGRINRTDFSQFDVVIVDKATCNQESIDRYLQIRAEQGLSALEVLLNCESDIAHNELLLWQNLAGVFYTSDSLERLTQGLEKVIQGELWLSRRILQNCLMFYRERQSSVSTPVYSNLTPREKEIIKLLGEGASNSEIANALFVSENTVKTHLHNVFKKIKVKNRLQALLWVKDNIASQEFS